MAFNIVAGVNNAVYGSVSGSGSYVEGAEVTLEVTANDGYRFVSWDDGSTDNPRIFNASEDVTLVATLEAIPEYAISVTTNDNSLGTVSGSGTFREGTSTQISASPYVHSRFVNWEDGNSDNPRTITVLAAATYKAIFEAVGYFTISTDVNDANLGSVTGAGEYDEGDTVTLTAIPETGCRFVSWNDGNTDNPRIFTSSVDITYTATFEEIQYTDVTIASNEQAWGTVSGATSGNIETGTTITLTASPATDYKFDGWQVDGEIISVSPTASFLVDGQEMDIIAVFSAIVFYQVTLMTNDIDCGSISVVSATAEPRGEAHNIWPDGTILNLRAVTTEGGKFLNWSTGQVATEITVNVHGNETIRANFYPVTGLILVTKKILNHTWTTIKNFFAAPTGASKIGAPANNALGATTLADVVSSVGQSGGIAMLNNSGKVAAADIDGTLANDTTGNAATATVAEKVGTTTVGASDTPIYLNAGTATACGGSLAVDITGNAATATTASACSGNAANVTGTVAIGNGGTGATTRLNALKALTNESVGTNATYFLTITNSWGKGGYTSVADAKTVLGIAGSIPVYYVQGPSTDTTAGTWTGSITGLTAYYDGLTVLYVPAVAGASATTLNINSLGAKTCYTTNTSALTTHYSVGTPILLTYRDNAWRRADYNSNTTYSAMSVSEGTTGTATTSRTMRADYLKQIIAALPSASCTGASASCTGNAATATTATNTNNAKLTHTVGNTEYPLVFGTSFVITDAQQALRIGTPSATANQCPLRVKAYCADANTQGEAYLVLGNALAKASANNARGGLVMYGTGTAYNFIKMNTVSTNGKTIFLNTANTADITLTLPSATGTIALTSSNITGSSASCTGNAATATTATNANNVKLTTQSASADMPLVFGTTFTNNNDNQALHICSPTMSASDSPLRCKASLGTTSANGQAAIMLGNNISSGSTNNARGYLYLYGAGSERLLFITNTTVNKTIVFNATGTTERAYTFPDATGTIALQSSCDPEIKTDIQDVYVLDKLKKISVKRFHYSEKKIQEKQWKKDNSDKQLSEMPEFKDNEHEPWYIHAMAQEFNEAFDVSDGDKNEINLTNSIGVCLRAIQELAEKVDNLEQKLSKLS